MTVLTRRRLLNLGVATLGLFLSRPRLAAATPTTDPIVVIDGWVLLQSDLAGPDR